MARPRIFVSSSYYDLKHLRSSLENFVDSLGFDAILSEKGKIAYTPDVPLDESCYREVASVDIFVLIVGGRYGSEMSSGKSPIPKTFYDRYNSITRGEYRSALEREVPIYVLIERSVYAEYETYLRNKSNKAISYAHVDSVNIFELIEDIVSQPRNNPIQQFDKYSDIETWLREQWSGLFRELLQRIQQQAQLSSLQAQVAQMSELNTTFKRYLEEIVSRIAPKQSEKLIKTETKRLEKARVLRQAMKNPLFRYLTTSYSLTPSEVQTALLEAKSFDDFVAKLATYVDPAQRVTLEESLLGKFKTEAAKDLNLTLHIFGKKPFPSGSPESDDPTLTPSSGRTTKKQAAGSSLKDARPLQLTGNNDTEE